MLRSPEELAKHFRLRAEELRGMGGERVDTETRDKLYRIAKNYEHMADQIERCLTPAAS